MVYVSVTCLERHLNTLEAKDTQTSSDLLAVERLLKKIEALDVEFKEHHYAVIDLVEDHEQVLDDEQAIMNDYEEKVAEIIECLQELRPEAKAALSVAHSTEPLHHLRKRVNDVERNLRLVKGKINLSTPAPGLKSCLLLQLEEQVGSIKLDLSDVTRDILSSEKEEEDLLEQKDSIREALFNLGLQIEHLLQDRQINPL